MSEGVLRGEEHRHRVLEKAAALAPLDAVYFVMDQNRWGYLPREDVVELSDLPLAPHGESLDQLEAAARALHRDEFFFGNLVYRGGDDEDSLREMEVRHPGFSRTTYQLALTRGMYQASK